MPTRIIAVYFKCKPSRAYERMPFSHAHTIASLRASSWSFCCVNSFIACLHRVNTHYGLWFLIKLSLSLSLSLSLHFLTTHPAPTPIFAGYSVPGIRKGQEDELEFGTLRANSSWSFCSEMVVSSVLMRRMSSSCMLLYWRVMSAVIAKVVCF